MLWLSGEQRDWGQPPVWPGDTGIGRGFGAGRDSRSLASGPWEPRPSTTQTHMSSLLGLATPHGHDFFLPSLYEKQMEVFAQACSFPNKQTLVNCGVEQGLGLPAVPSPWARMAAGSRDRTGEGRAPFPISHPFWCIAQEIFSLHNLPWLGWPSAAPHLAHRLCAATMQTPPQLHNDFAPNQLIYCPLQSCPCESITNSFAGSSLRAHTHLHPGQSLLSFPQALSLLRIRAGTQTRLPRTVPIEGKISKSSQQLQSDPEHCWNQITPACLSP